MAIAIGQHAVGATPAFGSATSVVTSAVTTSVSGSAFVGSLTVQGGASPSSVLDSFSNIYTLKQTGSGYNNALMYLCDGGTGGAGHTLTANFSGAQSASLFLDEVTGAANPSYDVGGNGSNTSGSSGTFTGAAVTTTNANDLILSFFGADGTSGAVSDSGAGFSIIDSITGSGQITAAVSYQVVSATGTYQDTYITGANYFAFAAIALKAASGGGGAISGTAAITFGQSGALKGAGALTATAALTFGQSGSLKGNGALIGTSAITFGTSATLAGAGALAASAAVTFGANGTLAASGTLVGSAAVIFAASGTLIAPSGALSGTASFTFGASAALRGSGALTASAAIAFGTSGALKASGALAGLTAVVFAASGTLTPPGAITGVAGFSFGATGNLQGSAALAGSASILWNVLGTLENAAGGLQMPNLIGLNFYEALQVLQGLGIYQPLPTYAFAPSSISVAWQKAAARGGFVLAQSVAAASQVVPGMPIQLTVSTFPFGSVIDSPPDWKQAN